ncbi:MAG: hypothetical protein P4L42_00675 [Desulfocapsaceae bacterium]|nr:hypothetical protein [Desulfocapsaceae bacterium]
MHLPLLRPVRPLRVEGHPQEIPAHRIPAASLDRISRYDHLIDY